MLAGALTQDDVIRMVDHQNKNPPPPKVCTVIGEATTDFTLIETGNFLTDAMKAKAGADVALFLDNGKDGKYNGKGVSARFSPRPPMTCPGSPRYEARRIGRVAGRGYDG